MPDITELMEKILNNQYRTTCIHYDVKLKLTVNRYIDNTVINIHLLTTETGPLEHKAIFVQF